MLRFTHQNGLQPALMSSPMGAALAVLGIFLIGDALAISGHLALKYGLLTSGKFYLYEDRGYPELLSYLNAAVASALFCLAAIFSRKAAYLTISGIMLFIMIDDAAMVHEQVGDFLAQALDLKPVFGLSPDDFAELFYFFGFGLFAFGILVISYFKTDAEARKYIIGFIMLMGLLAVFVVLIDIVHSITARFGGIEDGGEMIVLSMIAGLGAHAASKTRRNQRIKLEAP